MSSQMLDWACSFLAEDRDIVVPVRRMWREWGEREPGITPEKFESEILGDPRIEIMIPPDSPGAADFEDDKDGSHRQDMEELGFFRGPRVKLKTREITPDHIARMLKKHTDRMIGALRGAIDTMPENCEQEDELLEAAIKALDLQRKMETMGIIADESSSDECTRLKLD